MFFPMFLPLCLKSNTLLFDWIIAFLSKIYSISWNSNLYNFINKISKDTEFTQNSFT